MLFQKWKGGGLILYLALYNVHLGEILTECQAKKLMNLYKRQSGNPL